MRAETQVGLNVKCPLFLADINEKGNGPFFPQNTSVSNFRSSFMCAGDGPYQPFRSNVNALRNNNKKSPFVFAKYFVVIHEVGQAACTTAVTYS
jgi:hypothetical protein